MRTRMETVGLAVLPLVLAQDNGDGFDFGTILWYLLVGLIVGIIARLLVPGTGGMSWILTIVLGVIGALVGGYLWEAIFGPEQEGIAWIGSIIVAAILVWAVTRMGAYGRRPRRTL
jgi:uncharacterized membrane protein YeaQ/YmgE (transglycosylase-associated protein family)